MSSLSLLQGDLPDPGIEPRSPALQADSFLAEPPGKPKNTGVGSLSLLQGIFPTQESTQGLLCCRGILYQLSYQGSPIPPPSPPLSPSRLPLHPASPQDVAQPQVGYKALLETVDVFRSHHLLNRGMDVPPGKGNKRVRKKFILPGL